MEQHITKYNEFYSKNGQFVGGTDSMITSLFTGIENISGGIFNMIVRSAIVLDNYVKLEKCQMVHLI